MKLGFQMRRFAHVVGCKACRLRIADVAFRPGLPRRSLCFSAYSFEQPSPAWSGSFTGGAVATFTGGTNPPA